VSISPSTSPAPRSSHTTERQGDSFFHSKRIFSHESLKLLSLWIAPLTFLALFYFFPLGNILRLSFARGDTGIAGPIITAITSPSIQGVIWFTLWQATLSTLLTLMIGLPGAYLLARYEFRGKSLFQALSGIPFVLPTLVVAAAFNALLGPRGWVNIFLMDWFDLTVPPIRIINTITAILIAHVFYNTTIVLRMVGDFWSHLNPQIAQAARSLGANSWQTLRHVTLPLLLPAITTASLLIFIFNFTSFGVILVLGGPRYATMEVEIYYQTISLFNLPLAAALSVIQLGLTLILTIFYTRLSARISRPLPLRARKITQQRFVTWRSRIMAAVIIPTLLIMLTAPLFALSTRSFTRLDPARAERVIEDRGITLDFYRALSESRRGALFYVPPIEAIRNSLVYASATVFLALILGLPASWALTRNAESPLNRILDPILMLPLGTSAVTLGLGFIISLNRPPLDLRASPLLIPIAHTLVAFPFVVRSLTPALRSIQPRIRQAASVLGATPIAILRHIDLPLIGRAVLVAATFAFMISMGEFGATAIVSRPEFPTIPVVIYRFITQPGGLNYGQALAMSTILMAVTAAGMIAIERFRIAKIGEF
jgi:thiamine transport system permease protein